MTGVGSGSWRRSLPNPRRGRRFEHVAFIIGSPKAGTARPDVCTVTRGRVLVHGLGLGCYLKAILAKTDRTTGEPRSPTCPLGCRLADTWHDICSDNLPEMATLKRRYGRRVGWQGCWGQWQAQRSRAAGW